MAENEKRGRGRPPQWHTKITAPPLALELYALIAKLQKSDAFATCHVYHGAKLEGVPMVKWNNKVHRLPFVVASYMGLPSGLQQCDTPGCCNPFHFLPPEGSGAMFVHGREKNMHEAEIGAEEWADLVDYELDKRRRRIESTTFEEIREWIPVEDLSDDQLRSGITYLKEKK